MYTLVDHLDHVCVCARERGRECVCISLSKRRRIPVFRIILAFLELSANKTKRGLQGKSRAVVSVSRVAVSRAFSVVIATLL